MSRVKSSLLPAVFVFCWILTAVPLPAAVDLEVGRPFPDLRLPSIQDGELKSIKDFRGKKLILHVWASW